jgi:hypothetical protein
MPWIALVCACVVGACSFDADYSEGTYTCHDGKCPSNLTCIDEVCVEPPKDAALDTPTDMMIDARQYALTCNDPQPIAMNGPAIEGDTTNRSNMLTTSCNGSMMLGFDAVYRLDNVGAGKQVNLSITAAWSGAAAYIIQPCATGSTCIGNIFAQPNVPVNITTIANGPPYIVVDSTLSGTKGDYTVTVSVN